MAVYRQWYNKTLRKERGQAMKIMSLKIPKKPHQLERIHPDFTDGEYIGSEGERGGYQVYGDISTEDANNGFKTIEQFKRDITALYLQDLDKKIAQLKGAIKHINNCIEAQKFTQREHKVDEILVKSCHTKIMLEEMLQAAEEDRNKNIEEKNIEKENFKIIKEFETSRQNSDIEDSDSFQFYEDSIHIKFPGCNPFLNSYISNEDIIFVEMLERMIKQNKNLIC